MSRLRDLFWEDLDIDDFEIADPRPSAEEILIAAQSFKIRRPLSEGKDALAKAHADMLERHERNRIKCD